MNPEVGGEDFLDFKCPHCGALNSFPASAAGLVRECMNCLEAFIVPTMDGGAALSIPLPYETAKIRLRKFEPTDWEDLLEFEFDDEDQATSWLYENSSARLTDLRKAYWLAVQDLASNKVIGSLGLNFASDQYNQVRIDVSPSPLATTGNLMPDIYRAALGFCFAKLRAHRVATSCTGSEQETRAWLIQSGLRQEGEFVKDRHVNGDWLNTVWFAMLAEEFFKNNPSGGEPL